MGYTTDFVGEFTITPALTQEQIAYLQLFNKTRRMCRSSSKASELPDPLREAVGLPIGDEAEFFVGGTGWAGQNNDESVVEHNDPPKNQPGLWCQWTPSDDGTTLGWDGGEKFYDYVEWLAYIDENFLNRWGRTLSGIVSWQGEDIDDYGMITAGEVGIHTLPRVK